MAKLLLEEYRKLVPRLTAVYVFQQITCSSVYNPYLSELYTDLLNREKPEIGCTSPHPLVPVFIIKKIFGEKSIVHYHWLEFDDVKGLFVVLWKLFLMILYRMAGGTVVWTIHDEAPHANKYLPINRFFQRIMVGIASRFHVHCETAARMMAEKLGVPASRFFVVPHPLYTVTIMETPAAKIYVQQHVMPQLCLDEPLFLCYGFIAAYKRIIEIVRLFPETGGQLVIAGHYKNGEKEYYDEVCRQIRGRKNILLYHVFLSQEQEQYLCNAADCFVFNFRTILTSGSVILGLSYKKPVIVPAIGCLAELSGPLVIHFDTQEKLGEILREKCCG